MSLPIVNDSHMIDMLVADKMRLQRFQNPFHDNKFFRVIERHFQEDYRAMTPDELRGKFEAHLEKMDKSAALEAIDRISRDFSINNRD